MDNGKTLEQLNIADWDIIVVTEPNECLLLWKRLFSKEENCPGFYFHCVEFFSSYEEAGSQITQYQTLFHGTVCFDGVRHLYFGSEVTDNYGYLYYCHVPQLISALSILDKLQVIECPYVRDERKNAYTERSSHHAEQREAVTARITP